MTRIWQVAKRDYLETVRSSTFIVMVMIVPMLVIFSIAIPRMLERTAAPSVFAMVDLPPAWVDRLQTMYTADADIAKKLILIRNDTPKGTDPKAHLADIEAQVRDTRLLGYVSVGQMPDGERIPAITARTAGDDSGLQWLRRNLPVLVRYERAAAMGLSPEQVARLDTHVDIQPRVLSAKPGESRVASDTDRLAAFAPMIFTYMLWIVIFTLVQRLIMSTIEEKSNRTIEILLSSVSPMELMAGKVLSGVLEGATVLAIWLLTFFFAADYFTQNYMRGLDLTILFQNKAHLAMFVVYFALGYILFAALVVGLGSLCNTVKDTQGLMTPVMMTMMVPIFVMSYVQSHPNTPLSIVLSWIPFFTPFLMMNRIASNPPPSTLEIAGSFVALLLAIYGTTWAGAKLFRVGILLYGKRPSLPEVMKILTTPEGRAVARVT